MQVLRLAGQNNMAKAYDEVTLASTNLLQLAVVALQLAVVAMRQQMPNHKEWRTRGHSLMVGDMV